MDDLINRKATLEALNSNPNIRTIRGGVSGIWINLLDVVGEIERVPAAKPVQRGKWQEEAYLFGWTYRCSECGENYGMPHGKFSYCPGCGARMDGDDT